MKKLEIERKFIVSGDKWKTTAGNGRIIVQGYLSTEPHTSIRVREINRGEAFLTIKSGGCNLVREEIEIPISLESCDRLLKTCKATLTKIRYDYLHEGRLWTIDVFGDVSGNLYGNLYGSELVLAEIELDEGSVLVPGMGMRTGMRTGSGSEDVELKIPEFCVKEVTGCREYYNEFIARKI